jgi:mycothiol synthase
VGASVRPFEAADEAALRRIMAASLEFDAFPGFTPWELDREADSIVGEPANVAVAVEAGVVRGYVSARHEDLTVDPPWRRRGLGRRLFAAALEMAARDGWDELRLCVPSTGPARAFASAMGMAYRSSMWRMGLEAEAPLPPASLPPGMTARPFGDWLPLPRYVELLNATFAEHPGNVSWTLGQVQYVHARPGFDPSGILVVTAAAAPDEPVAFVRAAMCPPEGDDPVPVGEVGLVGVMPEWRGRGLGRELLRWGVAWLRSRGAGRVVLSVEAQNERALGLYVRSGFVPLVEWPQWTCPVPAAADRPWAPDDTATKRSGR